MVGKRELHRLGSNYASGNGRTKSSGVDGMRPTSSSDIESGIHSYANGSDGEGHGENGDARPRPKLWGRFKDAANTALEDKRRDDLKKSLLEGIQGLDQSHLEKFRKSDEELKAISNKKVRKFYEEQNDRLNDWLEVGELR